MFEEARRPKKVSPGYPKKKRSEKDAKKPVKKGVSSNEEQDRGTD